MKTITRLTLALIAVLSVSTAAIAQDAPAAAAESSQTTKEITFGEGDAILGELAVANYMDVTSIGDGELPTLIRVRSNFNDLMLKDVEELP